MDPKTIPAEVPITLERACIFALECWRLGRISVLLRDSAEGAGLRHAVRRINETLEAMGIQIVDFAGRAYDPGMVPEVVQVREEPGLPNGHAVVEETIAPTVTWRGQVIKNGQIIVKCTPEKSPKFTQASE
jgi:hypothetical protein